MYRHKTMVITNSSLYRYRHNVDHTGIDVVELGQLYDVITGSMLTSFMFKRPITPKKTELGDAEYSNTLKNNKKSHNANLSQDLEVEFLTNKLCEKHESASCNSEETIIETTTYTKIMECHSIPQDYCLDTLPKAGFTHVVSHVYLGVSIEITYIYNKKLLSSTKKASPKIDAKKIKKVPGLTINLDTKGDITKALERNHISRKIKSNCGMEDLIGRESNLEEFIKNIPASNLRCIKYTLAPVDGICSKAQLSNIDLRLLNSARTGIVRDKFQVLHNNMNKVNQALILHNMGSLTRTDKITLRVGELQQLYQGYKGRIMHLIANIREATGILRTHNSPGEMAENFLLNSTKEYHELLDSLEFCCKTFLHPIISHNKEAEAINPNKSGLLWKLLFDRIAKSDIKCTYEPNVPLSSKEAYVEKKWSWLNMGGTDFQHYCDYGGLEREQVYNVYYEATRAFFIPIRSSTRMQNVLLRYANGNKGIRWDEASIISSHSSTMLRRMRAGFKASNLFGDEHEII